MSKFSFMKILKNGIVLSTFLIFPLSIKADFDLFESSPSFFTVTTNSSIDTSLVKYRTPDNKWGAIG